MSPADLDEARRLLARLTVLLGVPETYAPPASGVPLSLTKQDYLDAAQMADLEVALIHTVDEVESSGDGFANDGRPIIRFEPHVFSKLTQHRYDETHGGVSYPRLGMKPIPKEQAARWAQMIYAGNLDHDAAFAAASWGRFQIMGFNYADCGFESVRDFAAAMMKSEREQLMAFVRFILKQNLDDALRARNWPVFARGYNGPAYAKFGYDTDLANAHKKWSKA